MDGSTAAPADPWLRRGARAARAKLRDRALWVRVLHETLLWAFFLALPFFMLWWTAPFYSKKTFGNDYAIWSIAPQLQLMWSAKSGTFPLYMPGFSVGHSTAAMTLGQLYHPDAWLSAIMPGYGSGKALEYNGLFRFLNLGAAHAIFYKLSRKLSLSPLAAFLATAPAVYNLRMLDSFRYGASLESYTAMLMLAAACGFAYLGKGSKRSTLFIALGMYLLITSGHPQWAYLGAFAAGIFAALFPWIARAISPDAPDVDRPRLWRYLKQLVIGNTTGVLLTMPYLLTFYFEVLKTNHARAESTYAWTLEFSDSMTGELSNFLLPLHADVHGAFGGSALFLLVALFPILLLAKERAPKVLWLLYALLLVVFSFSAGSEGFEHGVVHKFIVKHIPGFGVFRVPGRIVLMIPVLAWPLWAWVLKADNRRALGILGLGGSLVFASKWFWRGTGYPVIEHLSPLKILGKEVPPGTDDLILYLSGATLVALALAAAYKRARPVFIVSAIAFTLWSSRVCLEYGTWRAPKTPTATYADLAKFRRVSASAHNAAGEGMELRGVGDYNAHHLPTGRSIGSILHDAKQLHSEAELWPVLVGHKNEQPLFLDTAPAPASPEKVADLDRVRLLYNTSNRYDFDVTAGRDGYFLLGIPYIKGFVAQVDGVDAPVSVANALYPAVFVPRGNHRVGFHFVSKPFITGVAIAFLTLVAWLVVSLRHRVTSWKWRGVGLALIVLSAIGLSFGLRAWLYLGRSFRTEFTWQASADPPASARPH